MHPIKTARNLRGISQTDLAGQLGILPQSLNSYESGARQPGPKLLPKLAAALNVDAAYLRGDAQRLAVWDWQERRTLSCAIASETYIDGYGAFYLVEVDDLGVIAVIMSDGVQFTLSDWQGRQPLMIGDIADTDSPWFDVHGRPAIMLDGLPRMLW